MATQVSGIAASTLWAWDGSRFGEMSHMSRGTRLARVSIPRAVALLLGIRRSQLPGASRALYPLHPIKSKSLAGFTSYAPFGGKSLLFIDVDGTRDERTLAWVFRSLPVRTG